MSVLNEVHTRLVIDIEELTVSVEKVLRDFIVPHIPGLYTMASKQPLIDFTKKYYTLVPTGGSTFTECLLDNDNIINHKGMVYDEHLEPIGDLSKIRLNTKPTLPYNTLEIIKEYASTIVFNRVKWGDFPKLNIYDFIEVIENKELINLQQTTLTEPIFINLVDGLETVLMDIRTDIHHFMGRDLTNYYDIDLKGTLLFITKMSDYRIYEYEQSKRVEKWKEQLEAYI